MTHPTIHLNGTSRETLLELYAKASDSLGMAYDDLKQAAPNGRDYYTQGPEAMDAAVAEHMDRLRRLDALKAEIDCLYGHVIDG